MTKQFHDPPRIPGTVPADGDDMTAKQGRATPAAGGPAGAGPPLSVTARTRHRRLRALGRVDRAWLYAVLDAGWSPTSG